MTVEEARTVLRELVRWRRQLRQQGADASTLEANRLAIVYWQRQLWRAQHP
jgi:hypothetical protein